MGCSESSDRTWSNNNKKTTFSDTTWVFVSRLCCEFRRAPTSTRPPGAAARSAGSVQRWSCLGAASGSLRTWGVWGGGHKRGWILYRDPRNHWTAPHSQLPGTEDRSTQSHLHLIVKAFVMYKCSFLYTPLTKSTKETKALSWKWKRMSRILQLLPRQSSPPHSGPVWSSCPGWSCC